MSNANLDPFTQKLLQRTQERKEARLKIQHLSSCASPSKMNDDDTVSLDPARVPLIERDDNQDARLKLVNAETGKKRLSSENMNTAPLSPLQKVTVRSTSIELSPKHTVQKSSLASRLNRLNQQYEEQLQLDCEEEQRQKELQIALSGKKKEEDAKRARDIQERIFGREYLKKKEENNMSDRPRTLAKKPVSDSVLPPSQTAKLGLKSGVRTESFRSAIMGADVDDQVQHNGDVPIMNKENPSAITENSPLKQHVINNMEQKPHVKPKPVSVTENNVAETGEMETVVGSVKDKMSIFEEKVMQETAARLKEKEAENWLLMKGCRKSGNVGGVLIKPPVSCGVTELKTNTMTSDTNIETKKDEGSSVSKIATESNVQKDIEKVKSIIPAEVIEFKSHINPQEIKSCLITESSNENRTEQCGNTTPVKALPSMTETPVKNYTGLSSPQPVDCTEDTMCDTQLDVTCSLLESAPTKLPSNNLPPKVEPQCYLKNARLKSTRCSTMKVEPSVLAMLKPLPELNMTPIAIENETVDEEGLSDFAKAIKGKVKDLKSSGQKKRLEEIDIKTQATFEIDHTPSKDKLPLVEEKAVNDGEEKSDQVEKKKTKKQPVKPPRAHKRNVDVGLMDNQVAAFKSPKERHHSADDQSDIISKPEKYSRKKLRKSSSFSEGQSGTPVKSGYHRELSEKYNACASFDKPDLVVSTKMQIQNLLEEAASQQNIVLQASQALNVAEYSNADKSTPEVVEGERLLLLATERRTICLEEVKILKETQSITPTTGESSILPCTATLALTDIKLPLHREFLSSLRNRKTELGAFHFVMIVSTNFKNIHSTKVVSCSDEIDDGALCFKSNVLMKNVPHDFTLTMKVFGMHNNKCNDQIAKVKKGTGSQSSPGNLKNLFSKKSKEDDQAFIASPQTVFRTSNFKLVGECKVNLSMFGNGVAKYVLTKVPSNCPVEGYIQLRANCKPEYSANVSGFLTILEDVGGYTAWNRRWCILKDDKVMYWRYPDDAKDKDPMGSIDLRYCCDKMIKLLPRDICARPQTFELNLRRTTLPSDSANLITTIEGKIAKIKYWVCCDNKGDRVTWMDIFNKQLSDSRAWRLKKVSPKSPCSVHHV